MKIERCCMLINVDKIGCCACYCTSHKLSNEIVLNTFRELTFPPSLNHLIERVFLGHRGQPL